MRDAASALLSAASLFGALLLHVLLHQILRHTSPATHLDQESLGKTPFSYLAKSTSYGPIPGSILPHHQLCVWLTVQLQPSHAAQAGNLHLAPFPSQFFFFLFCRNSRRLLFASTDQQQRGILFRQCNCFETRYADLQDSKLSLRSALVPNQAHTKDRVALFCHCQSCCQGPSVRIQDACLLKSGGN